MLNLQRNLRKLNLIILIGLLSLLLINNKAIYAYWNSVETSPVFDSITIIIGKWGNIYDGIMQLDPMTDEELKQPIPDDTLFMYQGRLYIKRPSETYIPLWHGMPGEPSSLWAVFALDLEWIPNTNYRNNSVVIRNGKYYITNTNHNNNWFTAEPGTDNHWIEIEPINEQHFGVFPNTNIKDYANPDFNYVVYK